MSEYKVSITGYENKVFYGYLKEEWRNATGELHRENGPAIIVANPRTGDVHLQEYYWHGWLHRENGPARIERYSEQLIEEWFITGKEHRDDAPAYLSTDPATGRIQAERWYTNGEPHKIGAPAMLVHKMDGSGYSTASYYINGVRYFETLEAMIEEEYEPDESRLVPWLKTPQP